MLRRKFQTTVSLVLKVWFQIVTLLYPVWNLRFSGSVSSGCFHREMFRVQRAMVSLKMKKKLTSKVDLKQEV
jgi:hypothetical protein